MKPVITFLKLPLQIAFGVYVAATLLFFTAIMIDNMTHEADTYLDCEATHHALAERIIDEEAVL